jgi:hypothetical protein
MDMLKNLTNNWAIKLPGKVGEHAMLLPKARLRLLTKEDKRVARILKSRHPNKVSVEQDNVNSDSPMEEKEVAITENIHPVIIEEIIDSVSNVESSNESEKDESVGYAENIVIKEGVSIIGDLEVEETANTAEPISEEKTNEDTVPPKFIVGSKYTTTVSNKEVVVVVDEINFGEGGGELILSCTNLSTGRVIQINPLKREVKPIDNSEDVLLEKNRKM